MKKTLLVLEDHKAINQVWIDFFQKEFETNVKTINSLNENIDWSKYSIIIINSSMKINSTILTNLNYCKKNIIYLFNKNQNLKKYENIFYLEKPIKFNALNQEIKKVLSKSNTKSGNYKINGLYFNLGKKNLTNKKKKIVLNFTEKEAEIIYEILQSANSGINKNDLLTKVWNYNKNVETKTVETHIYRIRKKLSNVFVNKEIILNIGNVYKINLN